MIPTPERGRHLHRPGPRRHRLPRDPAPQERHPTLGRIIHVCHYLPIAATLLSKASLGVLSPPATPPSKPADVSREEPESSAAAESAGGKATEEEGLTPEQIWSLSPRHGHAAMISGILSLSHTHEQLIVGWTGDIESSAASASSPTGATREREAFEEALKAYRPKERDRKTKYVPVWLDDKVAHGHYDGYCKQTLWPLFHYLLWQDVRIADVYQPGDLIWVHDYHLLLAPRLVREQIPDAVIGLFVHTPFPSSEVFRCLPLRRKEILDGMLGANLTYSYSRHFISTCTDMRVRDDLAWIDVDGHVTAVMHCPVGIDAERHPTGITPKLEALRNLYEGKKIIVGRDKLDVLRAFEKLLQDYPQWIGNVVMIQVTSPALTDSPKLERMVSELVAHINGEYGSLDFIPVHHYHQQLKKDEFYALLSVADLALITPLRDGMNTTSMEFVIAQNSTGKNPSVLSEFMGISKNMEDALLVNPWNLGDVAAAINQGLVMDPAEKAARHAKLYKVVTTHTAHTWAAVLVKMLLGQLGLQGMARRTPYIPKDLLEGLYVKAKKRLFLFDYDGTLAPIVKIPSMATPSDATLEALDKLSADPKNLVYIISGRDGAFLEQHLGHLKNVGFSAEHGGFIRERGSTEWVNFTQNLDMSWMGEVEEIFRYYTERTTGSHIEVKKSSITWHYRSADPEWGQFQCRQCQDLLENNLAHKRPIEVLVGKKNLEVRPLAVNKGEIVKRILYKNPDAEFIFCAGDDKTDEDMFRALLLFPPGTPKDTESIKATMQAPVAVKLVDDPNAGPVELAIQPQAVFTTAVGHSSKRTLASWHVTTPQEVVD
ncbi:hypothetical protein CPB84DRAFT_1817530 [Gymnopilus junonius]|uniref:Glycosyltransferase family 20 protein n=1 Tax=Gymnopilus junonius TaxID=109634 RepID=A0A9P5TI86_GYMJU|nr:hypothetical protein CPB84DRAFT_1817530 [Gymnopilus junonius]